jgi:hypothetical protein
LSWTVTLLESVIEMPFAVRPSSGLPAKLTVLPITLTAVEPDETWMPSLTVFTTLKPWIVTQALAET